MTARREHQVARVVLRGGSDNALDGEALAAVRSALVRAVEDPRVRVIVLSSEGERFCSGLDLGHALRDAAPSEAIAEEYAACVGTILQAPKPVIARVHGAALGGGVGLVGACDVVVASRAASFALPEVVIGMIPVIATQVLRRRLAPGAIRSLALTARPVGAEDALRLGLVDELVEAAQLDRALDALLDRMTRASPEAVAATKRWLQALPGAVDAELGQAAGVLAGWMKREDVRAGARAFLEGQAPPWFAA